MTLKRIWLERLHWYWAQPKLAQPGKQEVMNKAVAAGIARATKELAQLVEDTQ